MKQNHPAWGEVELRWQPYYQGKDILSMCRYASLDQPRPRRCVELRSPCDECAREEQAKMDELGEEHMKCNLNPTLPDSTLLERTRHETR